jgi:predicted nucleic acid-binding protein
MKAFIDSDILIWHLRGEKKALRFLKKIHDIEKHELWTGAMQRAEVIFFMRPQEEGDTILFLSQFQTAPVNQKIVDLAGEYYRTWNPKNGMDINDAILAATAHLNGGKIYTLNNKHYSISDVIIQRAW